MSATLELKWDSDSKEEMLCERYLLLMAACIRNKVYKEKFLADPRKELVETVGMTIPEDAIVILDPNKARWPEVHIITKPGEYVFAEGSYSVTQYNYTKSGLDNPTITMRSAGEVKLLVDAKSTDAKIVVVIPFFTPSNNLRTEYEFKDETTPSIILSSC
jgi:hypothetical protein